MKFLKISKGQSVIEVVVALSLVAIIVLALVRVTISSIQNSSFARDQRIATQYAQEGMENARKLKEGNKIEFWGKNGSEEEIIDKFTRTITYTPIEENQKMEVQVVVIWENTKGTHQSDLSTYLTKWK